jgi:hypothetical protein
VIDKEERGDKTREKAYERKKMRGRKEQEWK